MSQRLALLRPYFLSHEVSLLLEQSRVQLASRAGLAFLLWQSDEPSSCPLMLDL
jgi:hypothetical protein